MTETDRIYLINLPPDAYQTMRQCVPRESPAWASVDSAMTESDGSLSFDCTAEEITAIIKDLDRQAGGGPVIAELIRQKSSQDQRGR